MKAHAGQWSDTISREERFAFCSLSCAFYTMSIHTFCVIVRFKKGIAKYPIHKKLLCSPLSGQVLPDREKVYISFLECFEHLTGKCFVKAWEELH